MPLSFPKTGNPDAVVGQTPWSARVPLDPLLASKFRFIHAVAPSKVTFWNEMPALKTSVSRLENLVRHPHSHRHSKVHGRTTAEGNAERSHRKAVVAERHVKKVYREAAGSLRAGQR